MTTVQLDIVVDSEAHPELYAVLSAIGKDWLRPERMRQLAAAGVIWERLRAQTGADTAATPVSVHELRGAERVPSRGPSRPRDGPTASDLPVLQDVVELPASKPAVDGTAPDGPRMPGPRSRLLLMKQRGLFRNS